MIYAGVDAGSRTIKVVLIEDAEMRIVGSGISDQGAGQAEKAEAIFDTVLRQCGLKRKDVCGTVATGYGRNAIPWTDNAVTEITCQAFGVQYRNADVRTIIDIGGQDSKLIRLDSQGMVQDFVMNDRCAAGTGRFLEIAAERLEMKLEDLGRIAPQADQPAAINSMCAVFAEAEMVGLLASGVPVQSIAAGVQASVAKRIGCMAGARIQPPIVFAGGVALLPGMSSALSKALDHSIRVAENPQMTAALGAAILAARQGNKSERIQHSEFRRQNMKNRKRKSKPRIQNSGVRIQDPEKMIIHRPGKGINTSAHGALLQMRGTFLILNSDFSIVENGPKP